MSDDTPERISQALELAVKNLENKHSLDIDPPAVRRIVLHTVDYFVMLLHEANQVAHGRRGDSIQSGDVDRAKKQIEGAKKGSFWSIAAGSALAGAGLQGLGDSLLTHKGWVFIGVYSASILLGICLLYFGSPRN